MLLAGREAYSVAATLPTDAVKLSRIVTSVPCIALAVQYQSLSALVATTGLPCATLLMNDFRKLYTTRMDRPAKRLHLQEKIQEISITRTLRSVASRLY